MNVLHRRRFVCQPKVEHDDVSGWVFAERFTDGTGATEIFQRRRAAKRLLKSDPDELVVINEPNARLAVGCHIPIIIVLPLHAESIALMDFHDYQLSIVRSNVACRLP